MFVFRFKSNQGLNKSINKIKNGKDSMTRTIIDYHSRQILTQLIMSKLLGWTSITTITIKPYATR